MIVSNFCESCGSTLEEDAKFCTACGAAVTAAKPYVPPVQPLNSEPAQVYTPPVQQQFVLPDQQDAVQNQQYVPPVQPTNPAIGPHSGNTEPLSVGQYILTFILTGIPVVGFILLLVWAFGSSVNRNRKNYARAILLIAVILFVVSFALSLAFSGSILSFLQRVKIKF